MIDIQLATEVFSFFAPARYEIALKLSNLAVRTTAWENAAWIAEFNTIMNTLASRATSHNSAKEKIMWMSMEARKHLPETSYAAKMYDFILAQYQKGSSWEEAWDGFQEKIQIRREDGYKWATLDQSCNGCFAAGINFGEVLLAYFMKTGILKKQSKLELLQDGTLTILQLLGEVYLVL